MQQWEHCSAKFNGNNSYVTLPAILCEMIPLLATNESAKVVFPKSTQTKISYTSNYLINSYFPVIGSNNKYIFALNICTKLTMIDMSQNTNISNVSWFPLQFS